MCFIVWIALHLAIKHGNSTGADELKCKDFESGKLVKMRIEEI